MSSEGVERTLHGQSISVVIPAYNAAETIFAAVQSALDQTHRYIEVIVCNDASTDATLDVLQSFDDPRLRVVTHSVNQGEGRARDRAIAEAQGEWVAVLDADDAWSASRLERMLMAAGGKTNVMVFDDLLVCHHHPSGAMIPWRRLRGANAFGTSGRLPRDVSPDTFIQSERLLIKPMIPRQAIVRTGIRHTTRRFGADSQYFIGLLSAGLGMRYLPEAHYYYRVMPGSATGAARGGFTLMREAIEECLSLYTLPSTLVTAIQRKLSTLQRNERLYQLAAAARKMDVAAAFGIIKEDPGVLHYAPSRVLRHLSYQFHRLRHSGSRWSP